MQPPMLLIQALAMPMMAMGLGINCRGSSECHLKIGGAISPMQSSLQDVVSQGNSSTFYQEGGFNVPDYPDSSLGHVSALSAEGGFGNATSKAAVDKLMLPLVYALGNLTGAAFTCSSTYIPKTSSLYIAEFESSDSVGTPVILGSRLVTRDFMKSSEGPGKGLVVAGPAVWANADVVDSALRPIWRKALVHVILARGWHIDTPVAEQQAIQRNLTEVDVPILKTLDPATEGGCYLNEADGYEEGFQDSFWGSKYARLYKLKQKWDPENLFIVRTGIGSEDWDAEGLCPK
ncbi:hypothetical protein N7486_002462 [Penicillium sp. IBT 16267x]|nr:hypothetical protein N7486_002462 [Penicillium sp. IBT 16267x]